MATLVPVTITNLPNAATPLTGTERVAIDQAGVTVDAPVSAIAALATTGLSDAVPQSLGTASAGTATSASRSDHRHALPTAADVGAATAAQGAKADTAVQPAGLSAYLTSATAATTYQPQSANLTALVANDPSYYRARGNHTGTQAASTITGLAAVATSGAYADLSGRPTAFDPASPGAIGGTAAASGEFTALSASSSLLVPNTTGTAAGHVYRNADTLRYRDSANAERLLLNATDNLANLASTATARTNLGIGALTPDGSGNLTLSARFVCSVNGAASAPPVSLTGTWFSGGTSTTTKPQCLIEPAGTSSTSWSTAGTGLGVNAPSGFTGNLLDLQINGVSNVSYSSSGGLSVARSTNGSIATLAANGTTRYNFGYPSFILSGVGINLVNSFTAGYDNAGTRIASSGSYEWSNSAANTSTLGVGLFSDGSGIIAQRNATNGQASRVYRTYTDSSNYERVAVDLSSNTFTFGPQAAGTGILRPLYLSTGSTTVANLASAATVGAGSRAFVTDATATTFLSTVAGGGSNKVPVVSDGTNWLIG